MRHALSSTVLLLALAACSGGSSDSTASVRIPCINGQAFCLISCDLGCGQTGCAITEIAENQRLRFVFSDTISAGSVNSSSVSLRTTTGVQPNGDLLVAGRELTFVPRVTTVNGVSSFGFLRNESYIITFAGGVTAAQGIRSISGATLSQEFSCTVLASRGILDEDQLPPTVEMLSPTNLTAAPLDPTIVLRFSELIDTTPLQAAIGEASPIRLLLRGVVAGACDRDAEGIALSGIPRLSTEVVGEHEVTVVTIQPSVTLPGNSCVTVSVTADIRDLSGRQGIPADFEFLTVAGVSTEITISEPFANETQLNIPISGGSWASGARPAVIGGDGRHGSFVPTDGTPNPAGEFEFSTDSFQVTAARSLLGVAYLVTDGKFYFTDFIVPEGTKVRFVGTVPPQIHVRGRAEIRGSVVINAEQMPFWIPTLGLASGQRVSSFDARGGLTTGIATGQLGGSPGVGGGRGGKGGDECPGSGPVMVGGVSVNNGLPGQNVRLPGGHAYAGSAGGTAGQGSVMTPTTGVVPVSPPLCQSIYRALFSPGGSGGGYAGPGGVSTATALPTTTVGIPMVIGAAPAVGQAFPVPLPTPLPSGYTSLNHFLVGGSGGGGGGSHPFATRQFIENANGQLFLAGSGGTGGGGAMALRVGRDLVLGNTGVLNARGGDGVIINGDSPTNITSDIDYGISSPGGGGSGGSLLLQSATSITMAGTIDVSGGVGSRTGLITPATINVISQAGAGSPGFYRLEANGNISFGGTGVPAYMPAQNAGPLNDRDQYSGCTSKWYSSGTIFPPQWLRYELDVDVNGTGAITTFTDSGTGTPANEPGDPLGPPITIPVSIVFQGALLNQAGTEPVPGPANEWRPGIGSGAGQGIGLNPATGFRFNLTFNRTMFPMAVVRALRVYART